MTEVHVRQAGRTTAARALIRLRVVAVVVLVLVGLGSHPAGVSRPTVLALVGLAAALLSVTQWTVDRWSRRPAGARARVGLFAAAADAVVVLGVVHVVGPPPGSLAVILLLLPLVEAALFGGLAALALTWVGCVISLAVLQFVGSTGVDVDALEALSVALPLLLITAVPIGLLGEHLVAEVARLSATCADAEGRARVLTDLAVASAGLVHPDVRVSLEGLVSGATLLGAVAATVTAPDGSVLARDGAAGVAAGAQRTWQLDDDPRGGPVLAVGLAGDGAGADRLVEALDLLVAQARVALAHARRVADLGAPGTSPSAGLVSCDLDGLAGIVDRLGHDAGGTVLASIVERLDQVRPAGSVLVRLGADEFALIVADVTAEQLRMFALQVEVEVGRPVPLPTGLVRVGVRVRFAVASSATHDVPGPVAAPATPTGDALAGAR